MSDQNEHVIDKIDALLNDLLSPSEKASTEAHCAECPICKVALQEGQRRLKAMQSVTQLSASDRLIRRTERKLANAKTGLARYTWPQRLAMLAASVAMMIGTAHMYYLSLSASAVDLRVLGQNEWLSGTRSSLRVLLVDPHNGLAMAGVPITVELVNLATSEVMKLTRFSTNEQGTGQPDIQLPDWPDGDYELRVSADVFGPDETITRSISLKRSWQLMVSTDKPVYQPGQTILVRSLGLRRPDLKPVAGEKVVFSITDPRGNIIKRKRDVTSRYGIASVECPLADEIIHGNYKVTCKVGDTASHANVEVKDYVLPKFGAVVELDKPYYQPGEEVRALVQCDYFFGKPVTGGTVEVTVSGTDLKTTQLASTTATTDSNGLARISFRLPRKMIGTSHNGGDASFRCKVSITDSGGQKYVKEVVRRVTNHPLKLQVIPEPGLVSGVSSRVYLLTTYADGRPAKTRVAITGFDSEIETSDSGAAFVEFTPKADARWNIKATDEAGLTVHKEVELDISETTGDFMIRLNKAVYQAGTTMELEVLGGGVEPVFVDLIQDGQTILTDSIAVKSGQGTYSVDLSPELSGTLQLVAYRYQSADALPLRKTRVIYVQPASNLTISTSLDKDEYRPGDTARLRLQVLDADGQPAPGAISLSAVDEAVYSVQSRRPGMEQSFFNLQDELLKPVFATYPWSPRLTSNQMPQGKDRETLELALFAKASEGKAGNRQQLLEELLPFLDGDTRVLDALNRPDWELLLPEGVIPEDTLRVLKEQHGQHTLNASTYPQKKAQTQKARREGLSFVSGLWALFFFVTLFVGFCCVVTAATRIGVFEIVAAFVLAVCLISLLLPAVQQAREASRRTSLKNDLRNIGLAAYNMAETNGPLQTPSSPTASAAVPRVREWFPETLLWRPEVITDDRGMATVEIPLADSITTWRLNTSAVSSTGQLGASESGIRVFQPYFVDMNLPVSLTRGDEVSVPVVVYNYLEEPQTVSLKLKQEDWFQTLGDADVSLDIEPGEVLSASIRIKAESVGEHQLQVTAMGNGVADAVKRQIEVVPDGRRVDKVTSTTLNKTKDVSFYVPEKAIAGSARMTVQLYASSFSQVVEGLDAIFRRPTGCFEQTSSSTYPNVLALNYLQANGKSVPEVELKARQYIHLGYQRLLGFEIPGGGFDWFGSPPANRTLSAYGLMEFEDMAQVHDVDPQLIRRTRSWLMKQRKGDGSWSPESHKLHDDPTGKNGGDRELTTTAYIAWAVFRNSPNADVGKRTQNYLLHHSPHSIDSAYTLALVSNALLASDPHGHSAEPYLQRLMQLKKSSADGRLSWWSQQQAERSMFYGTGRSGDIETTATVCLALLKARQDLDTAKTCLAWLAEQKDKLGTWHSTQATVLALKALLEGSGQQMGDGKSREIRLLVDDAVAAEISIPAEDSDVMQQIDLSRYATAGRHTVTLQHTGDNPLTVQSLLRYHVPESGDVAAEKSLSITVDYNQSNLTVDDSVTATAQLTNATAGEIPMVVADLPIPPGFVVNTDDFKTMQDSGTIAKFQANSRSIVIYLRELKANASMTLSYGLTATMPVKAKVRGAMLFEYYNEDNRARSTPKEFHVLQPVD